MSDQCQNLAIPLRRTPLAIYASCASGLWLLMVWVVHVYVPSDQGGLSRLLRPFLPYVVVAVLIDLARFLRGAVTGVIGVRGECLVLPWFWRRSRRETRWSRVARAEVDTVVGLGLRTDRLRLFDTEGRVRAIVARRWVRDWDMLLDAIRDRSIEIGSGSPVSAWDAADAEHPVRVWPRLRLHRSKPSTRK